MSTQLVSPNSSSDGVCVLFFALQPPPDIGENILSLAGKLSAQHALRGRMRPKEILHLSLHAVGDWSERSTRAAKEAARAAVDGLTPFEVRLDQAEYWPTSGAFVLREGNETNHALRNFHKRLGLALAKRIGLKNVRFNFTPHVTMLYAPRGIAEKLSVNLGTPIGWTVREFAFICSHVGKTHHETLGHWPLLG